MNGKTILKVFVALIVVSTLVVGVRVGAGMLGVEDSQMAVDAVALDDAYYAANAGCSEACSWCGGDYSCTFSLRCC